MSSPVTDIELADRILAFLEAHAIKNPDFDPDMNWSDERFVGEGPKSFYNAADLLKQNYDPGEVSSSFEATAWHVEASADSEALHDELGRMVNDKDYTRTAMPRPGLI